MLFLSLEDLEDQGFDISDIESAPLMQSSDRLFTRVVDLEVEQRQEALAVCKKILASGIFAFVAQTEESLIIWKEDKQVPQNTAPLTANKPILSYDVVIRTAPPVVAAEPWRQELPQTPLVAQEIITPPLPTPVVQEKPISFSSEPEVEESNGEFSETTEQTTTPRKYRGRDYTPPAPNRTSPANNVAKPKLTYRGASY